MADLKTRILGVDDDQRLRDLLVKYLGGEGYEVKPVPDSTAMDKQLARERYDLLMALIIVTAVLASFQSFRFYRSESRSRELAQKTVSALKLTCAMMVRVDP